MAAFKSRFEKGDEARKGGQGIPFLIDSPTNQQFPIFSNEQFDRLSTKYLFSIWQKVDDRHTAVCICTSWATKPENVDQLLKDIAG